MYFLIFYGHRHICIEWFDLFLVLFWCSGVYTWINLFGIFCLFVIFCRQPFWSREFLAPSNFWLPSPLFGWFVSNLSDTEDLFNLVLIIIIIGDRRVGEVLFQLIGLQDIKCFICPCMVLIFVCHPPGICPVPATSARFSPIHHLRNQQIHKDSPRIPCQNASIRYNLACFYWHEIRKKLIWKKILNKKARPWIRRTSQR